MARLLPELLHAQLVRTSGCNSATDVDQGLRQWAWTHKEFHVACAKDQLGRRLGDKTIPTTAAGYADVLAWAQGLGAVETFGLEGTGNYGAGRARHLRRQGEVVVEVIRPNRQARRRNGKSDPADADAAASAVLSGDAAGPPKSGEGAVEMIRVLRVADSTAIKARTQAANAMKALVVTAARSATSVAAGPVEDRACPHLRPVPARRALDAHGGHQGCWRTTTCVGFGTS